MAFRSITPNITINTDSGQLRTELQNTFTRLDGQLTNTPFRQSVDIGPFGNTAGTETDLVARTIPYNILTRRGSTLVFTIAGQTGANTNNKTIKVKFGSTTIFDSGAVAMNNSDWTITGEIIRSAGSVQTCHATFISTTTLTTKVTVTNATEDLGTNLDFTVTGNGTAASDVTLTSCTLTVQS